MRQLVVDAASQTKAEWKALDDFSLTAAAKIIRAFLMNYSAQLSRWKPWARYPVKAVIAILDMLIKEHKA